MNDANEQAQPKEQVVLQIVLTNDGTVKVVGPMLADKTAAYGLLEVAKDIVREVHQPKVIRPTNFLQGLRNGGVGR